jgi:hypothetical protein
VFRPLEGYSRSQELCHNCDTKPVFTGKADFIDRTTLLILRNLLKTRSGSKIPAYRLIRHNYMKGKYLDFSASEMRQSCDSF